jgi:hypothetical protein
LKTHALLVAALLATTACSPSGSGAGTTAAAGTGIGVDLAGLNKQVKPATISRNMRMAAGAPRPRSRLTAS